MPRQARQALGTGIYQGGDLMADVRRMM